MLGGDGLGLGDGGGEEGVVGKVVGLARQPLEAWKIASTVGGSKSGSSEEAQPVSEVRAHLVAGDAAHVGAHDDALSERVEGGHAHAPS